MGKSEAKVSILGERGPQQRSGQKLTSRLGSPSVGKEGTLREEPFHTLLTLELRRAERSRKSFVLLLLDIQAVGKSNGSGQFIERLSSIISGATRDTDIVGWYEEGAILGVIFTEINVEGESPITELLHSKVMAALRDNLDQRVASKLIVTAHLFPENREKRAPHRIDNIKVHQDLSQKASKNRLPIVIKRGVDVIGSTLLLLVASPVLALIALAIKLTSKGPIIFEQERLGQFGTSFKCLKFRTMHVNNNPNIHRAFVHELIAGKDEKSNRSESEPAVYKITSDPRVTPIGKILRRASLDEFPQFWNVLRGEMSLVGPRPPLPYEFDVYDLWHRRRVLEMKPGVTGLWQVSGRSRVSFNDMVRLDLRYSRGWSLWLDLKILLATPLVVLTGDGAF